MNQKRIKPGPGQESVWDYPRPPKLEDSQKHIRVVFNGVTIADTHRAKRVLETSHPPVYYIPPQDVNMQYLDLAGGTTWCEWKGQAHYYNITIEGKQATNVAWYYPHPNVEFEAIKDYLAFYPGKMDACFIDDEQVQSQAGGFYGGWITSNIVGPFKGEPGTRGW